MSMKRSKATSSSRSRREEGPAWGAKPARTYDYDADVASKDDDAFVAYAPANAFAADALVYHRKFGTGIVTRVVDAKIEVLFEEGPRTLAHNPRGAAPAKARVLPIHVMRGVHWRFDAKQYATPAELATAVSDSHQGRGKAAGKLQFRPEAVAIRAPAIEVSFECADRENAGYARASATLESAEPTGFRQADLLWRIHQLLSTRDLGDHCFFEGLSLAEDGERPIYRLIQGS